MRRSIILKRFGARLLFAQQNIRTVGVSRNLSTATSPDLIVRSPDPDVPIIEGATIPEYVRSRMGNWGSSIAFECAISGLKLTHDQVWRASKGFGASLLKSELKRGDTVGILLPNHPFYAPAIYGIWDAGLVASTINPAYSPEEIMRQLKDSNSKCVLTIPPFIPVIRAAQKTNPNLKSVIVIGEAQEGCHTFTEMIKTDPTGANFLRGDQIDKDTVALLPYSSGTTGLPKGVMLTHANLTTHLHLILQPGVLSVSKADQERVIGLLPMFHSYGTNVFILVNMARGSMAACLPKFEPDTLLQAIRQFKPTILHLVTPLINLMVASPDYGKAEFESVHTIVGSAAPIGPLLVKSMLEKAGKYLFFQEAYGMTELSPCSHTLRDTTRNTKIGSCGVPMPNTLCKVITTDGTGTSLGANQRGEICVKGPQVMKGYLNNPEATKNTIDSEGWLHTGDIGYYDEDNHFYIVDRLKELIKVRGFQVAPAELEDLLRSHEGIADAAVIGIDDTDAGELPRGYIVKNDDSLSAEAVLSFMKDKIAHYKQLKGGIEFVESIPKSPSGKILRRELKEKYIQARAK